jgi:hypothetical protein
VRETLPVANGWLYIMDAAASKISKTRILFMVGCIEYMAPREKTLGAM